MLETINELLSHVKKQPYGCWDWQDASSKTNGGYIQVMYCGQQWLAHRLAYHLAFGDYPKELHVCHECDNPGCCNPNHLFLGTAKDNTQDAVLKGRIGARWWQINPDKRRLLSETMRQMKKPWWDANPNKRLELSERMKQWHKERRQS